MVKEGFCMLVALMHAPRRSNLRIYGDNTSVIGALAKVWCSNIPLNSIVDKFWAIATSRKISVLPTWISTAEMKEKGADYASRYYGNETWDSSIEGVPTHLEDKWVNRFPHK